MAKSLKDKGVLEAKDLQQRVRRQYTLNRISTGDYEELENILSVLITKIKDMEEQDGD